MNRDQILAILYEMSIVIGNEVKLRPLLTRTLQRLLFHTSFPCGLIFLDHQETSGSDTENETIEVNLELSIGDYELADYVGKRMILPAPLVTGVASLLTESSLLKMLPTSKSYNVALRLPINSSGVILLLSPTMPRTELPLTEIFEPVMEILAKAILLCRRNDEYIEKESWRQSEEKYRSLIQKIQAGVVVHDSDTRILISNSAAQSLLGLTEDQMTGKKAIDPDWHFLRENGTRMPIEEYPANLVVNRKTPLRDYVLGIHQPGKENTVWVLVNGDPVFQDSAIFQIIITFVDITIQKAALEALRKLNSELELRVSERTSQLEEANRELEAFAYSVSHDLRAPLRHIDSFLHLLLEDNSAQLDENGKHYIEVIDNSAKKMNTLIEDLLSFSRAGRTEIKSIDIDPATLIADIINEIKPDTQGRVVEWNISQLPRVKADPTMIRQVFYNLIANAIKFTRPRKISKIEIGSMTKNADEPEYVFFVRDNGVGFNMKYADHLFGVFQRLHGENEFEGTGIGLANVKRIITRHGGRVWAETEEGKSATFYFSLPIAKKNLF